MRVLDLFCTTFDDVLRRCRGRSIRRGIHFVDYEVHAGVYTRVDHQVSRVHRPGGTAIYIEIEA